jgi:type II secretory pathway pseudopilin PulG
MILMVAIAGVAACAFAQPQQQGRQNRMQQMSGMMLQQALDNQAAQSDPLQLIYRKDVQRDLGLDLGQRNKLDGYGFTHAGVPWTKRPLGRKSCNWLPTIRAAANFTRTLPGPNLRGGGPTLLNFALEP